MSVLFIILFLCLPLVAFGALVWTIGRLIQARRDFQADLKWRNSEHHGRFKRVHDRACQLYNAQKFPLKGFQRCFSEAEDEEVKKLSRELARDNSGAKHRVVEQKETEKDIELPDTTRVTHGPIRAPVSKYSDTGTIKRGGLFDKVGK